jgi:hypothetical protein
MRTLDTIRRRNPDPFAPPPVVQPVETSGPLAVVQVVAGLALLGALFAVPAVAGFWVWKKLT